MAAGGKVVGRHVLEAGEIALTVRAVHLADRNNSGRTRPLMVVGTSFAAGPPRRPPAPHSAAALARLPSFPDTRGPRFARVPGSTSRTYRGPAVLVVDAPGELAVRCSIVHVSSVTARYTIDRQTV